MRVLRVTFFIVFLLLLSSSAIAEPRHYKLTIDNGVVNYTGKKTPAMKVNQQIPAPVLRFKEGDRAIIKVKNNMDVETSIHWHGLLLPNNMDGVPYVTYLPIKPGETFIYEFDIRQAGTYWYHSHTMLQLSLIHI